MMECDFYSPPCGGGAGGEAVRGFLETKTYTFGSQKVYQTGDERTSSIVTVRALPIAAPPPAGSVLSGNYQYSRMSVWRGLRYMVPPNFTFSPVITSVVSRILGW